MNKKGFSLVEMIAVIALLGVIIAIAVPATASIRQSILEKEDASQIDSIESAAVYYAQDNRLDLSEDVTITVDTLLQYGYMDPSAKKGEGNCPNSNTYQYGCLLKPTDKTILNAKTITLTKDSKGKTKAEYQE